MKEKLLIIANNNIGTSQSGGDTIFLQFIKNWQKKIDITVIGSAESKRLLRRYQLKPKFIQSDSINNNCYPTTLNIILHCFRRTFKAFKIFLKHKKIFKESEYCYTASDFIPDFIFGLLYKSVNPKGEWFCAQYLFAPSPSDKNTPYRTQPLKGFLYYFFQKITKKLANKYADIIFITSEPDKKYFPGKKVIVVQGGVDITSSEKYLKSNKVKPVSSRQFDAVFIGRLHPQKGVLELVDIWKIVVNKIPSAKLALIGDGQLKKDLESKIKEYKLNKNITLFGFRSGEKKYKIFKESKIVLHPAIYDSGGMAVAEAMAWGLPGVSFDLESLKTYYPEGMLKSPLNNYQHFAGNIIRLLKDKKLYNQISSEALKLIRNKWDWSKRSQKIYNQIFYDK